jgi:hypothetical protein
MGVTLGFIRPDETASVAVKQPLRSTHYERDDCVITGGGVRLPPRHLHYSKSSSTLFVGLRQRRRLRSIHRPTIAPMPPRGDWRLQAQRRVVDFR